MQQPLLHNGRRRVVELAATVDIRCQRDDHDRRISRINFSPSGILREVRRKICARGVDRCLHVARRAIDVTTQIELQRNSRRTEIASGCHLSDACDMRELAFQRRGDRARHDIWDRARQCGLHADRREIHLR